MLRYVSEYPDQSDDEIVARHLGFMEARTRNDCYCGGLMIIRNQFTSGDPVRAYFALARDGRLVGGGFAEVPGRS